MAPDLTRLAQWLWSGRLRGVAHDSRRVRPGFVFVAIRGYRADGVDFVPQALERGAAAVVAERPLAIPVPCVAVPSAREALALLVDVWMRHPSEVMHLVGVTGTNGKTTVSILLREILRQAGRKTGLIGTLYHETGRRVRPAHMTTPDALELGRLLREMASSGVEEVAMEVSSHALALNRVDPLRFDGAVFTNVDRDHLDFHGDIAHYREAKAHLLDLLPARHPVKGETFAALNADDAVVRGLVSRARGRVITYGLSSGTEVTARVEHQGAGTTRIQLSTPWGKATVNLGLPGRFNVANALAAVAAAGLRGADLDSIVAGLEGVRHLPGRMQHVRLSRGVDAVVDFAHNPAALIAMLQAARQISHGRVVLVFGAEGEKDRSKRRPMGEAAVRGADLVFLTADNVHHEPLERILDEVSAGFADAGPGQVRIEPDRRRAIGHALEACRSGDLLVVAGKGHETHMVVGDLRLPFSDREVLLEWDRRRRQESEPQERKSVVAFPVRGDLSDRGTRRTGARGWTGTAFLAPEPSPSSQAAPRPPG